MATGCNRADTDENARRARGEMRELAGRASAQIADSWLATKIQAQYFADDDVKARDIRVSARNGVVLLRGVVDTEGERAEALSIARNTDGVARIDDQLRVGGASAPSPPQASIPDVTSGAVGTSGVDPGTAAMYPTDDAAVTTGIQAKFFRDSSLKARHIDVATQNGIVTLRGTVASDNERAQARLLAWTTHGVQRVDDVLTVDSSVGGQGQTPLTASPAPQAAPSSAPSSAPAAPTAEPGQSTVGATPSQDAALETAVRNRLQGAQGITVTAKDGVVLLDGVVPTAAAKQRAVTAARQTQGVVQLVDRLRVGRAQ
jgi:hyperosmotically inducible protein